MKGASPGDALARRECVSPRASFNCAVNMLWEIHGQSDPSNSPLFPTKIHLLFGPSCDARKAG